MVLKRAISMLVIAVILAGTVVLTYPTINRFADDLNLVTYFDHDESIQVDLIWYYFSGEKRENFQFENDYGLEFLYIADIAKMLSSRYMRFTPGTFTRLLRWLNLIFWLASLIVLWRLVRRHLGGVWAPLLVLALTALRPAFPHLVHNSKPDSIVLFFMILGIDYALRIIDKPSKFNLCTAVACASITMLVKYSGVFLLLPIIIAMYFANNRSDGAKRIFPSFRGAWLLPGAIGIIITVLSMAIIFFYVRQSTGMTLYSQYGFIKSLLAGKFLGISVGMGILLMASSALLRLSCRVKAGPPSRLSVAVNEMLSYSAIVSLIFVFFLAVFGFRWFIEPVHLVRLIATNGPDIFGAFTALSGEKAPLLAALGNFPSKMFDFDVVILALFIASILVEFTKARREGGPYRLAYPKRVILIVFVIPIILWMTLMRLLDHHMLPFVAASLIIVTDNIGWAYSRLDDYFKRSIFTAIVAALFIFDLYHNGLIYMSRMMRVRSWREDVVFDISKWWVKTYPPEVRILADHPVRAYLPPEYRNVRFLKYQFDRVGQMRDMAAAFKPDIIYYNSAPDDGLTIEGILPGVNAKEIAYFDNEGRRYRRFSDDKFHIYEIAY